MTNRTKKWAKKITLIQVNVNSYSEQGILPLLLSPWQRFLLSHPPGQYDLEMETLSYHQLAQAAMADNIEEAREINLYSID
jgi:hypothetical protein